MVMFPGELTHSYKISPKRNEVILFSTRLHESNICHKVYSDPICEGFDMKEWHFKRLVTYFITKTIISFTQLHDYSNC